MKLRFIYKYKGSKVEHDKFLHCKNQMSNQNLHAIKNPKKEDKNIEDIYTNIVTRHYDAKKPIWWRYASQNIPSFHWSKKNASKNISFYDVVKYGFNEEE